MGDKIFAIAMAIIMPYGVGSLVTNAIYKAPPYYASKSIFIDIFKSIFFGLLIAGVVLLLKGAFTGRLGF